MKYRVQLYGVPDKHLYDALPLRAWHVFIHSSHQLQAALVMFGAGIGILLYGVVR